MSHLKHSFNIKIDQRPGSSGGYTKPSCVKSNVNFNNLPQLTRREAILLSDPSKERTKEFIKAAEKAKLIQKLIKEAHFG